MNGVRYEQGTPAYQSKPRARAASTNWAASIIARPVAGARFGQRRLAMREVTRAAEVLEIVDAAPVVPCTYCTSIFSPAAISSLSSDGMSSVSKSGRACSVASIAFRRSTPAPRTFSRPIQRPCGVPAATSLDTRCRNVFWPNRPRSSAAEQSAKSRTLWLVSVSDESTTTLNSASLSARSRTM